MRRWRCWPPPRSPPSTGLPAPRSRCQGPRRRAWRGWGSRWCGGCGQLQRELRRWHLRPQHRPAAVKQVQGQHNVPWIHRALHDQWGGEPRALQLGLSLAAAAHVPTVACHRCGLRVRHFRDWLPAGPHREHDELRGACWGQAGWEEGGAGARSRPRAGKRAATRVPGRIVGCRCKEEQGRQSCKTQKTRQPPSCGRGKSPLAAPLALALPASSSIDWLTVARISLSTHVQLTCAAPGQRQQQDLHQQEGHASGHAAASPPTDSQVLDDFSVQRKMGPFEDAAAKKKDGLASLYASSVHAMPSWSTG